MVSRKNVVKDRNEKKTKIKIKQQKTNHNKVSEMTDQYI